jgi:hypothetical protein
MFAAGGGSDTGLDPRRHAMKRGAGFRFVVGATLVVGVSIGFAGGFAAGQRGWGFSFASAAPEPPVRTRPAAEMAAPAGTGDERAFSEAEVAPPPDPAPDAGAPEGRFLPAPLSAAEPLSAARAGKPAAPSAGTGAIQVLSRPPGAQVLVDGRAVGRTPLQIPSVRAGFHDVRIELPGFRRWATSVQVAGGDRARVAASLEQ